jgi:hypothetical protein
MAIGSRYITIRVDVDTGEYAIEKSDNVTEVRSEEIKKEIEAIRRGAKRFLRLGEIIQTKESPGCVYWDGVSWARYC